MALIMLAVFLTEASLICVNERYSDSLLFTNFALYINAVRSLLFPVYQSIQSFRNAFFRSNL